MTSLTDKDQREFHAEEYRQLRTEVGALLARIETQFRYAVAVPAGVYAWLVTSSLGMDGANACRKLPVAMLNLGWVIPVLFVACMALMAVATARRVTETGRYLGQLEQALGAPQLGWEAWLATRAAVITDSTRTVWLVLFLGTVAATGVGLKVVKDAGVCPGNAPAQAKCAGCRVECVAAVSAGR